MVVFGKALAFSCSEKVCVVTFVLWKRGVTAGRLVSTLCVEMSRLLEKLGVFICVYDSGAFHQSVQTFPLQNNLAPSLEEATLICSHWHCWSAAIPWDCWLPFPFSV